MSLRINKPGLLTTVQDLGRYGYQAGGMIVSGAMDQDASRVGNILLGNDENAASLEITLKGPEIQFDEPTLVAITGANLSPRINGKPVRMWRAIYVQGNSVLTFGRPVSGCRAYLAVASGIKVDALLGSRSTYLRAGMGGWQGRALKAGDVIPTGKPEEYASRVIRALTEDIGQQAFVQANWMPDSALYHWEQTPQGAVSVVPGPEYDWFDEQSKNMLWCTDFKINIQSDRMGYRLDGNALKTQTDTSLLSTAVTFGSIQVPSDGKPIVLMADHQTTGGYPVIGQVISADLARLSQLQPGQFIRFKEVSMDEAEKLYFAREKNILQLKRGLKYKILA